MITEQARLRADFRQACAQAEHPRVAELLGFLGLEPLVLAPAPAGDPRIHWCSTSDPWLKPLEALIKSAPSFRRQLAKVPAPGQGRFLLGRRIEALARWTLSDLLDAELIAHNLPIYLPLAGSESLAKATKEQPRRTIGELDLIYRLQGESQIRHRELAAKWYIFDPDTRQEGPPCPDGFDAWWGPMRRDRLDLKLTRMCNHQITLGQHPATHKALGNQSPSLHEIWLNGQLFWPLHRPRKHKLIGPRINPRAICGHWARHQQWCNDSTLHQGEGTWFILEKPSWLMQLHALDQLTRCRVDRQEVWDHPRMLARCQSTPVTGQLQELQRIFVVPNDWGVS